MVDTEEGLIELSDIMDGEQNMEDSCYNETPFTYQGLDEIDTHKLGFEPKEVIKSEAPSDPASENINTNPVTDSEEPSQIVNIKMEKEYNNKDMPQPNEREDLETDVCVTRVKIERSEDIETETQRRLMDIEVETLAEKVDVKQEPLHEADIENSGSTSVKEVIQEDTGGRILIEKDGFEVYIKQEPVEDDDVERDIFSVEAAIKNEPIEDIVVEVEVLINEGVKQDEINAMGKIKRRKRRPKGAPPEILSPEELRRYECQICKRRFLGKGHLNTHIRTHTGEKPFECEVCKRRFIGKGDLNKHLRIHTGEKPFVCVVCQQGFSQKSILNRHFRIHTGEKAYECQTCHQKFTVKSHLDRHLITHTGEKAHECQICLQRFSLKSTLDGHLRIHTGEKPFECEVCQQRFSQSSTLNRHFRIHTGERPYECQICQQRFALKSTLNGHLKTHSEYKTLADMVKKVVNRK